MRTEGENPASVTGGYRAVFEAAPDAMLVHDAETTAVLDANRAAVDLFGRSREELLDVDLATLGLDSDESVSELVEREGEFDVEWQFDDSDGDTRWVEGTVRSVSMDGSDWIVSFLSEAPDGDATQDRSPEHDVDGQLGTNVQLHQHPEYLETVAENLPIILFALDTEGTFTISCGSALEQLGLEPGEAVGSTIQEMYADHPDVRDAAERALEGEDVRTTAELGELLFETWYRPVTNQDGDVQQVLGVSVDITEQRERERRLEEREAILQQLTETTDDVFWLFDSDFSESQFVNDAYESVWGRSVAALQEDPMDFMEGVHPDDRELMLENIERLQNGESIEAEYRVNPGDDFQRWVSVRGEPIYDDQGALVRVAGYAREITDRKETKQKLVRRSKAIETTADGIGIFDADEQFVYANQAQADIYGYDDPEALLGNSWRMLYDDDQIEWFEATVLPELLEAGQWRGEVVGKRADGTPVPTEISLSVLDSGELVGVVRDITDRKEQERQLTRSERQFEAVFNDPQMLVGVLDTDGVIQQVNETAVELSPADREQIEGTPFPETPWWAHDEELQSDIRRWISRAAEGTYVDYETVHPVADDEWITVEGSLRPVTDEDGEVVALIVSARDITERKKRERQLEELSEATEDLSYAKTPDEVAERIVDIAGEVLEQQVVAMWQYDDETDRLLPWTASPEARAIVTESGSDGLGSIPSESDEMSAFRGGEPTLVNDYQELDVPAHPETPLGSLLLFPIGDYGLLNVGSLEVGAFDAAERNLLSMLASHAEAAFQRAEREHDLETYKNKLEESNENLQEFAYIASHDLQEPLRSVTSYLDLIESEYHDQLDDDGQFYIERAESNASRMSEMIDALLQYSRVETEASEFSTVDADKVLSDTLDSLTVLVEESGAEIVSESLPTVVADENQLGQVFQNLLKNAVEHGGDPPEITITATETDEAWEFAVADNGSGIPEAQHDRVFEIFQQASADDDSGEAGIGLAICERIVSRHQGDIWVESNGNGATFTFTLPKNRNE